MDCQRVKLTLSAFQDGRVVESERRAVAAHLSRCGDCSRYFSQLEAVRQSVRSMPRRPVPAHLAFSLRSIASREAARRRRYTGLRGRLQHVRDEFTLFANNLMRPLALPAAGGLASAVFLFSMVMTNFRGINTVHANDVPLAIATEPSVRAMLLDMADAEIFVDVFVDGQGRVIDFSFPEGYGSYNTSQMRRKLENSLVFTEFNPATTFGQPTSGWVRVKFRGRSEIDVKG
jgi:hypothetical protein